MSMLQTPMPIIGQIGNFPNLKTMVVTDMLSAVETAGYLNQYASLFAYPVQEGDLIISYYQQTSVETLDGTHVAFLAVSINEGIYTLNSVGGSSSGVTYTAPTVANHIAVYDSTLGVITGDVATAINNGNIQAGSSGTPGSFISYPTYANTGSLVLAAGPQGGNYVTTIQNNSFFQNTLVRLADPKVADTTIVLQDGVYTMGTNSGIFLDKTVANLSGSYSYTTQAAVFITNDLTTPAGSAANFTLTNNFATTSSGFLATGNGGTNTNYNFSFQVECLDNGTINVGIFNNSPSAAFNGNIVFTLLII